MFIRVLQVIAAVVYVFGAIGVVAYLGASLFWLVPLLAPAMYFIFTLPDISPAPHPVSYAVAIRAAEERRLPIEARIAELKSGPPHRNKEQYIDSVSRGIPYSDERIDYLEFPEKLVLCEHLRPIEAAMRAARLPMDFYGGQRVEVSCIMRAEAIRKRYSPAECVEFGMASGADNHAPPINVIRCRQCGDSLEEQGLYGDPWPV